MGGGPVSGIYILQEALDIVHDPEISFELQSYPSLRQFTPKLIFPRCIYI